VRKPRLGEAYVLRLHPVYMGRVLSLIGTDDPLAVRVTGVGRNVAHLTTLLPPVESWTVGLDWLHRFGRRHAPS